MSDARDIVVVGAGVIGVCCACWLQRDGHRVTLVDRGGPGEGCSFGNSGLLSPGALTTAALPGAWRSIPRWLVDPLGPLAIRWSHLPRMLPWVVAWARNCREENVRRTAAALRALHAPVFDNYAPLLAAAGAGDLIRRTGQLYVSEQDDGAAGSALVRRLREEAGVVTQRIAGDAVRDLEPALGPQYRSGLFFPEHGHSVNSYRLVTTLATHFVQAGGRLLRREVRAFERDGATVRRLLTDAGAIESPALVIAAGAWSARLASGLGLRFPLQAERGYHLTIAQPAVMPRVPLINRDYSFTTTPMENGLRFSGTAEFAGLDAPPDDRRARVLLTHARRMLPALAGEEAPEATSWMGSRPSLPDGLPVIDRAPGLENVHLAFGHAHFGLTEAPTTARLLADLVAGRTPVIDPSPYRATRFVHSRAPHPAAG